MKLSQSWAETRWSQMPPMERLTIGSLAANSSSELGNVKLLQALETAGKLDPMHVKKRPLESMAQHKADAHYDVGGNAGDEEAYKLAPKSHLPSP
mmetsp:Transcript_25679/g.56333  ORF Transcript_25679/g.56333 Transcript_25679/m.56333 type:complete len:95 (+) Transcript_25679:1099-1383(+)